MKQFNLPAHPNRKTNIMLKREGYVVPATQAARVFAKFGNANRLRSALAAVGHQIGAPAVYRWGYPVERHGTGGIIPPRWLPRVLEAARVEGIVLTEADLSPVVRR